MRAALVHGAGDVRVEDRPDPKIHEPTDAVVRVLRAAICGQAGGGLQAEPDVERLGEDSVQQFLAAVLLFCRDGGLGQAGEIFKPPGRGEVADDGEGEVAGRGEASCRRRFSAR